MNIVSGQYNVDVRVVDVETGAINATDGATWARGTSYRELMKNLASQLMSKMTQPQLQSSPNQTIKPNSVVILYNYLRVYPEDLGTFSSYPNNIIEAINNDDTYGYSTWRLPTEEEMSLINNNKGKVQGLFSNEYMTIDGNKSGRVRLVTNREPTEARAKMWSDYQKTFSIDSIMNIKKPKSTSDSTNIYLNYYQTFLSYYPKSYASYYGMIAQEYVNRKEYGTAISYLKQALDIQPDYADALALLTDCYTYTSNSELAIKYAKQGARFGHKGCIEWLDGQNIRW